MDFKDEIKKILVIRFRRVGDAVLSSTLCSSLKRTFPNAEVHYVLNKGIAPLFENHPDIDKVIAFDNNELDNILTYTRKVWNIVRENKYDIIVDTRSTVKTMFFTAFTPATKYRIGKPKLYNMFIQNYRIENEFDGKMDVIDLNLALLKPLEDKYNISRDRYFKLYIPNAEKESFKEYMTQMGIDFSRPIMVCAVAAREEHKALEYIRMGQLLEIILKHYPNLQLIFNYSGDKEKQMAQNVFEYLNKDERIFMNIEANTLRELGAMFLNSNMFFGNEGGPRHIAQALGIPAFAIFPADATIQEWLPNQSDTNKGIEFFDIHRKMALKYDISTLSEEQKTQYELDEVWLLLSPMLAKIF